MRSYLTLEEYFNQHETEAGIFMPSALEVARRVSAGEKIQLWPFAFWADDPLTTISQNGWYRFTLCQKSSTGFIGYFDIEKHFANDFDIVPVESFSSLNPMSDHDKVFCRRKARENPELHRAIIVREDVDLTEESNGRVCPKTFHLKAGDVIAQDSLLPMSAAAFEGSCIWIQKPPERPMQKIKAPENQIDAQL